MLPLSVAQSARAAPPPPHDGPAPCTAGPPPDPYRGYCATYGGANTYFGSYGLGFPTPLGWGMCAWPAGSGGAYPSPFYNYALTDPPTGADTRDLMAFGFAMSEAVVTGFWAGNGSFNADQAAVAAKLYYDALAWHTPLPSMDAGVTAAVSILYNLTVNAIDATAPPVLGVSLPGGATSFTTSTTVTVTINFPGSNQPLAGVTVLLGLQNATFDANGATAISGVTDSSGVASFPLTASGPVVSVTLTTVTRVGQYGILFLRPTTGQLNAQEIVAAADPIGMSRVDVFTANAPGPPPPPPPAPGSVSVHKEGNDPGYFSVVGAQFEVLSGSTVLDTLSIDASGNAGPSAPLAPGSYVLHESVPPPGYQPVADHPFAVLAGTNTAISLTGADGDLVYPAQVTIFKRDRITGVPLAGAVFDVAFDPTNSGSFTQDLGTCTTDAGGQCAPTGNDGSDLLPGDYQVTEVAAPPGYALDPSSTVRRVELGAGEAGTVTFTDVEATTSLFVQKSNATEPNQGVPDATYDLFVQGPPPQSTPPTPPPGTPTFANMTWYAIGTTDAGGHLGFTIPVGYSWCVLERSAPQDFLIDPGLRCTARIDATTPDPVKTVAVSEAVASVTLDAYKFNASHPGERIPGASYALFVNGSFPIGFTPPPVPAAISVPPGMSLFATATTDAAGSLSFTVPSGYAWCLEEVGVPTGYLRDDGLHCTAVLTSSGALRGPTLALPELAATGTTIPLGLGVLLVGSGVALVGASGASRRRQGRR